MTEETQNQKFDNITAVEEMTEKAHNHILQLLHIYGLVQDCSNSIGSALELLQSCTEKST